MDEEEVKKVIVSVASDLDKTEPAVRRNSTGKTSTKSSPSRLSGDEKLPHYLRASTGSCHDYCKHGTKHVFEAKKRLPARGLPNSSEIPEKKQAEVKTVQRRSKKPELKLKITTQPKDQIHDKSQDEIRLSNICAVLDDESFEATENIKLPVEHSLSIEGEESSVEHFDIKIATPSPMKGFSDLSETIDVESLSPVEKRITSEEPAMSVARSEGSVGGTESIEVIHEPAMSVAWSEGSVCGPESVESIHEPARSVTLSEGSVGGPECTEPMHEPINDVKGSPDELLGLKMSPSENNAAADILRTPSTARKSLNAETLPPARKSISSIKASPSSREDKSSVKAPSMKLKTPSLVPRNISAPKEQNQIKTLKMVEGKKKEVLKSELSDRSKGFREKRIVSTGQSALTKKIPSTVERSSKISEQKSPSSVEKVITSVSPRVTKQKVSGIMKQIDAPARPSISSKSRTPVTKSAPSAFPSARLTTQRSMKNIMIRSINLSSRSSLKEIPSLKLMKNRSLKSSPALKKSPPKVGKPEITNEKVKEKTLYVVEPKTVKKQLRPIQKVAKKSKEDSSSQTPSSSSRYLKSESKRIQRRSTPIKTEEKGDSLHKLKFQRGKVVNPETENNAPRRLKFRQAKGASEKNSKEVGIVIRRRRLSIGSSADLSAQRLEAPKVILRHQDVQEKEIQGLLNQVIEETASKLVETRKSKVKALVGAFETVISLQESRVPPIV